MFGFFIGVACLLGLIYMLRGGRSCGRGGHFGRFSRKAGMSGFARRLFETLDTSPGQEKEIRSAINEFFREAHGVRDDFFASRSDVAKAMRGDYFDETSMGELFARQDDGLDKLRRAVVGALARVHAVLDEHQRARLAELIEKGPWRYFRNAGPSHV
ncbi:MAG TPA: periplasmic heavy metal sensor [Polyangiaceae bacterium]|nr:periplasmic heavy metal sensor [Polyangiaceae bacterium]